MVGPGAASRAAVPAADCGRGLGDAEEGDDGGEGEAHCEVRLGVWGLQLASADTLLPRISEPFYTASCKTAQAAAAVYKQSASKLSVSLPSPMRSRRIVMRYLSTAAERLL